jgi:flavorubredoxin
VGVIDWDRRLFDELIPLPEGTSYNSYIIKGSEKTALIDTADPSKEKEYIENLKNSGTSRIDYVISNHAEQDHSGAIPAVLKTYPEAKVVTNPKCRDMLKDLLLIPDEKFITVNDAETLSLGNKTLEFTTAAWVHWPETMFTYLREDKVLFTCDFLGSHLATSDLFSTDEPHVYRSAKRYYAEIMMPFRANIKKHLEKVGSLQADVIAPSHGTIHKSPKFILDAYREWVSDEVKNEVVMPYVSMHGTTFTMVSHFTDRLLEKGIAVKPFNLTKTDIGELAMALVDAATIVIGCPTVLAGPHPAAVYAAYLANALRPKTRFASVIGSFSWGGRMLETITGMLSNLKVELIEPVIIKGFPRDVNFKALDRLADTIAAKHNEIGILK